MNLSRCSGSAQDGRVEGDRMAAAVGQHVEVIAPVALAVGCLAAQHLAHRVDVGGRSVDVRAVGGADGVGEELALGAPVRAGCQDIGVGDPVIPAQHSRAELAVGADGLVFPGLVGPQVHHLFRHCVGRVVVPPVLGRFVDWRWPAASRAPPSCRAMPAPVRSCVQTFLSYTRYFTASRRIHRGGVGDGFDGHESQFRPALVDVHAASPRSRCTRQDRYGVWK